MLILRVERLVFRTKSDIGIFETVGFIRSPEYSNKTAQRIVESIPEMQQLVAHHGTNFKVIKWDSTHEKGDSLTSWVWRIRRW